MSDFNEIFGFPPEVEASAPGRVNLLGEHTDYNGGFVLPTAIPQRTRVELAHGREPGFVFFSEALGQKVTYREYGDIPPGFARYVAGCVRALAEIGQTLPPVAMLIHAGVPMGMGLSSSAALEVAVLRGLRALFGLPLDDVQIAKLAQRAEIRYAGVNCGIMDQMAASFCGPGEMLYLDTRNLESRQIPFPAGAELLVLDSGRPRSLATSAYNRRRAECEEAARRLGVVALRDIDDPAATETLPEPLRARARHVITENLRVLRAAAGVSAAEFGALMNASHASLRDDFEVSVPALDLLVGLLQAHSDVYGARLTGAGFGGACVAFSRAGAGAKASGDVLASYRGAGYRGKMLV